MDLKVIRMLHRVTQWKMAKETGLSQTKLSLIENGYITPTDVEKLQISRVLCVEPNEIDWKPEALRA